MLLGDRLFISRSPNCQNPPQTVKLRGRSQRARNFGNELHFSIDSYLISTILVDLTIRFKFEWWFFLIPKSWILDIVLFRIKCQNLSCWIWVLNTAVIKNVFKRDIFWKSYWSSIYIRNGNWQLHSGFFDWNGNDSKWNVCV